MWQSHLCDVRSKLIKIFLLCDLKIDKISFQVPVSLVINYIQDNPVFEDHQREGFWKHNGKRRKLVTIIFSFSHNVPNLFKHIWNIFEFLSVNNLKMDKFKKKILCDKVLLLGKRLKTVRKRPLENIAGKEKKVIDFSFFSYNVFSIFKRKFDHSSNN